MAEYKDIITCWLNDSKDQHGQPNGNKFLTIHDVEKDTKTFLNMHKFWVEALQQIPNLPRVPMFTKSIRLDAPEPVRGPVQGQDRLAVARQALMDRGNEQKQEVQDVTDDIPF